MFVWQEGAPIFKSKLRGKESGGAAVPGLHQVEKLFGLFSFRETVTYLVNEKDIVGCKFPEQFVF
jgi:hypothetical protein